MFSDAAFSTESFSLTAFALELVVAEAGFDVNAFDIEAFWVESFFLEGETPDPVPDYTVSDVLVRAYRRGHFDGYQRAVEDTFYIDSPYEFSPYWMRLIDTPPADWLPLMRNFDADVNRNILRPTTDSEARLWALTGEEPPEELV